MHVDDQWNDGQLVNDCKYYEGPVEKDGAALTNRLDNAAVVAQFYYELQEKLVFPLKFLKFAVRFKWGIPEAQKDSLRAG